MTRHPHNRSSVRRTAHRRPRQGSAASHGAFSAASKATKRRERAIRFLVGVTVLTASAAAGAGILALVWNPRARDVRRPPEKVVGESTMPTTVFELDTMGMPDPVAERLRRAREIAVKHPASARARGQLGEVCHAHGLYDCAVQCYVQARRMAPDDGRWAYLLAVARESLGQNPETLLQLYRDASMLRPTYPTTWMRMGRLLAEQGRYQEAGNVYRKAVALKPDWALAHRRLGQTMLNTGELDEALTHLIRAADLVPDDGPTYAALAQVYARLGRRAEARQAADQASVNSDATSFYDPIFDEVSGYAVNPDAAYRRANQFLAEGNAQKALEQLKALARLDPANPHHQADLAITYLGLGATEAAQPHLQNAMRMADQLRRREADLSGMTTAVRRLDAVLVKAWVTYLALFVSRGPGEELDHAIVEFQRATRDLALNADAHVALGNARLAQGNPRAAVDQYRIAGELSPNHSDAWLGLGAAFEKLGRLEDAIGHYRRASTLDPSGAARRRLAELEQAKLQDTGSDPQQ